MVSAALGGDLCVPRHGAVFADQVQGPAGTAESGRRPALLYAVYHEGGREDVFPGGIGGDTQAYRADGAGLSQGAAPVRQVRRVPPGGAGAQGLCLWRAGSGGAAEGGIKLGNRIGNAGWEQRSASLAVCVRGKEPWRPASGRMPGTAMKISLLPFVLLVQNSGNLTNQRLTL